MFFEYQCKIKLLFDQNSPIAEELSEENEIGFVRG